MSALLTKPGDKRVARGQANRTARVMAAELLNATLISHAHLMSNEEMKACASLVKHLLLGKAICALHARPKADS